ncbi:hypothetical protein TSUD_404300 [Trifolium subterraneum]|uniref:Reverse transcriptase zinc-binding domain-containing protein n=1 Tax=Trifolium subterraneum TaxID=3900 RepID=A0A2Z6P072_TRISU|nr:hypothetical protein TSUD_404300 [Trifolium subterraneum]
MVNFLCLEPREIEDRDQIDVGTTGGTVAKLEEADELFSLVVKAYWAATDRNGHNYGKDNIEEETQKMTTNIKQCLHKVADGHFTAAVKVFGSSGVAPYNEDTMKILGDKYPYKPPPSVSTTLFSEAPLVVDVDTVFRCITSFPKGTWKMSKSLLGGAVSRDKCFIEGVTMKRDVRVVELMHLLPRLRDPQSELLLLHSCMVEDIVVGGGPFFGDLKWRIASLPIKVAHTQDFLLAISIEGLGQHMSPVKYCTVLKYRLMILLFPAEDKEAPVNFLTDPLEGRSTLRSVDVQVYEWVGGKHACVDLTEVLPLVGVTTEDFTVGQTTLKAASSKVAQYEIACSNNQHAFIPFAFDTFGFLAPYVVNILQRIQRVMHRNVVSHRLLVDREGLWFRVLATRYGVERGRLCAGGRRGSAWWREVAHIRDGGGEVEGGWFGGHISRKVGDGGQISADMFQSGWGVGGETWVWRRQLRAWEDEMLGELQTLLFTISLQAHSSDRWLWQPDLDRGYSVRSAYQLLTHQVVAPLEAASGLIWHSQVPLKVSIFAWRLLRDRLPTKANLTSRGILLVGDSHCVSGCGAVESAHHVFISCSMFGSLWSLVSSWVGSAPVTA